MKKSRLVSVTVCFAFTAFLWAYPAKADLLPVSELSFGRFIVTNNATRQSISVYLDGSFSFTDGLIKIDDPQTGQYQIDDLPPNRVLNIEAYQLEPMEGAGNFFTLKDFNVAHTNSNEVGLTTVTLGATAESSGNNQPYADQRYTGTIQILISF